MTMRAKVVIPLLLGGLFVVLLPFVVRPKHPASGSLTASAMLAAKASAPGTGPAGQWGPDHSPASPTKNQPDLNVATEAGTDESPAAKYEDYVSQRLSELEALGMTGDANSLITIESELDSRDPRIQAAAVSAAVQFGSRGAIPALQDAYGHTDDPAQKLNIRKAIEFLELPSESEAANANPPAGDGSAAN
jgi:hypothetical protein